MTFCNESIMKHLSKKCFILKMVMKHCSAVMRRRSSECFLTDFPTSLCLLKPLSVTSGMLKHAQYFSFFTPAFAGPPATFRTNVSQKRLSANFYYKLFHRKILIRKHWPTHTLSNTSHTYTHMLSLLSFKDLSLNNSDCLILVRVYSGLRPHPRNTGDTSLSQCIMNTHHTHILPQSFTDGAI